MVSFFKTIFKISVTALLVSSLLVTASIILLEQSSEKSYSNRLEEITAKDSYKIPSYLIVIDKEQDITPWENCDNNVDVGTIINQIPLISDLPVSIKKNPLEKTEYKTLSWAKKQKLWEVYGRPYTQTKRTHKIAILLLSLGLDNYTIDAVTEGLNGNISFSFSPYASKLESSIEKSRDFGHETYIDMLLASNDVSVEDNGPMATSEKISPTINRIKKRDLPIGGIVLVNKNSNENTDKIIKGLNHSGLLIINATGNDITIDKKLRGVKSLTADIIIDEDFYPDEIQKKIEFAEHLAAEKGQVILAAYAKPSVIWAIKRWIEDFGNNNIFELVPISALVEEEFW